MSKTIFPSRVEERDLPVWASQLLLALVGGLLATVLLVDFYLEIALQGKPILATLLENGPTFLLACLILVALRHLSGKPAKKIYLSEAAKWCALGFGFALFVSMLGLLAQVLRGAMKPMVIQGTTLGSVAGVLVGYHTARLKVARNELRSITEHVRDGIYRAAPGGRLVFANQAFAEMFGYRGPEEVLEADPTEFYAHPEERERLIQLTKKQGYLEREEVEFCRKDGSTFIGLLSSSVGRDEEGRPKYRDGSITDITRRKRREDRLGRTSARLKALFEGSPDMIDVHDTEGNLIDPNPRLCEKTGYTEEELESMKVWDLDQKASPETAEAFWEEMEVGDRRKIEGRYRRKDGSTFPVEVHLRRLDLEGEDRFMAISRDITEQVRRERELRRSKRRYEAVFEDPNILVGLLKTDGTVLDINQTAMEYVEADTDDLVGELFWETPWFTGDKDLQKKIQMWGSRAACGEYVEFEADHSKALGQRLVTRGGLRPVTNEEGEVTSLLISARDVTGQKEHERKLEEAKEEAEQANRLKSAFLANMSHEIRTPLTSIIGFAEAIGEEVQAAEEGRGAQEDSHGAVPRFARLIEKSGTRLLETLNSVLNLSKLEAGEMNLSPGLVDLVLEAKREASELLEAKATEAGIDLRVQAEGPVLAWADRGGLRIVLRNLVSNAIKYTKEGGQVWVRARTEERAAVLEVEDTGIGMDPEEVSELFRAFKQGSEGPGREYEGTGLGLAVTKKVANKMGGSVEVETKKGEGSLFTVRLPRQQQDLKEAGKGEESYSETF